MNMGSKKFSKVGQLRTNFGSIFMIINYELITTYPRLIIKLELIIKKYFKILFHGLSLNSIYRIKIIILSSLFNFLQFSEV
jgi:hypothetical protein